MTSPSRPVRLTSNHAVVFHQLDDINALGDALATAARDNDTEHIANLRASLGRFAVAMGWLAEAVLPAILAYVDKHAAFAEDRPKRRRSANEPRRTAGPSSNR